MCVLAFAWQAHPRWRLVVAGNRDELHARPAAALGRWDAPAHLLAGRDLQSGGTWLGVSEQGRFVVVTNLRGFGTAAPDKVSRGRLVTDLLSGEGAYNDPGTAELSDFNPFNLVIADRADARFLSNRPTTARVRLEHGIYGLSNGALDEPWPKTTLLKARLLDWIVAGASRPETLLDALAIETLPDVGLRPPQPSDAPQEPQDSPIFIRNPVYGTRCSTVVAIDAAGDGMMIERRFDADGGTTGETRLSFSWPD
jgi:uncharacterized protein with NRDE domain